MARRKKASRELTFDLKSCRNLLGKLERELERIKANPDRDALTDHALNFAISAWHMTDWVWDAIGPHPTMLAKVAASGIVGAKQFRTRDEFRNFVLQHPAIRVCQEIATSAKHVGARYQSVSTDVESTGTDDILSTPDFLSAVMFGWKLTIVNQDGTRVDAYPIFESALELWTGMIYQNAIEA